MQFRHHNLPLRPSVGARPWLLWKDHPDRNIKSTWLFKELEFPQGAPEEGKETSHRDQDKQTCWRTSQIGAFVDFFERVLNLFARRLVIMTRTRTLIQSPRLGETLMSEDIREIRKNCFVTAALVQKRFDQTHKRILGKCEGASPQRLFLE